MARIDNLPNFLSDVAFAIKAKKNNFNKEILPKDFDEEIKNLHIYGDFTMTDASYLFFRNARIDRLTEYCDLYKYATNGRYMFSECGDFSNLNWNVVNTTSLENFHAMFANCDNLPNQVDFFKYMNVGNAVDMSNMFYNATPIDYVDMSNKHFGRLENMTNFFYTSGVKAVSFDNSFFGNVTHIDRMFFGCKNIGNRITGTESST